MAVTHMTLLMLGVLAGIGTAFSVLNVERELRVAGMFLASLIWGLMSLSAFNVSSEAFAEPQPVFPIVFVAAVLSIAVGALSLYHLAKLLGEETGASESTGLISDQSR